MKNISLIKLRCHPELIGDAAHWFHEKWTVPMESYLESIESCVKQQIGIPQWYLVLDTAEHIIGGAGIIDNDFHLRKDLSPNLCALYVEEPYRQQGIAKKLLNFVREDMINIGFSTLYLITDHTEFYEKCDWTFMEMVTDDDGIETRMYTAFTK